MRFSGSCGILPAVAAMAMVSAGGTARAQDLETRIAAAVHRGRAALLPQLSVELEQPGKLEQLALLTSACLAANVSPGHEVVRRALARLETDPATRTADLAQALLALVAHRAALEREGAASPRDRAARAQALADKLLEGEGGTWSSEARGRGDAASTELALLGLEAAGTLGATIPPAAFRAAALDLTRAACRGTTGQSAELGFHTPAWGTVTRGHTFKRVLGAADPRGGAARQCSWGWSDALDPGGPATPAATAAGAVALLVARRALLRAGELDPALQEELDPRLEGALLASGPAMASGSTRGTVTASLLAGLERLASLSDLTHHGKTDPRVEGDRALLRLQKANGTWGSSRETALALLALTRASRPLRVAGLPRGAAAEQPGGAGELRSLKIEASGEAVRPEALTALAAETRDPGLVPLLEALEKATPPERAAELYCLYFPVWSQSKDAVGTHALQTLEALASARGAEPRALQALAQGLHQLRELSRRGGVTGAEGAELLERSDGPLLGLRALEFVERHDLLEALPAVISKLLSTDTTLQLRARELLLRWAGDRAPQTPETDPPATVAATWREWWTREGKAMVAARRTQRLIEDMDHAPDLLAEDAALKSLTKLGPEAVPHILRAMEKGEYSLHLVRVLETITGKSAGMRTEDWKRALNLR